MPPRQRRQKLVRDLPEVGRVQYFVNKKGALGPLSPR
ncbi:hypothetical protein Tco_0552340, partial [Tanacetum coccineum]